jgi:hypothetical protein
MMTIDATTCQSSPSFPWKRLGSDFLYATVFNIGVALAIKFLLPGGHFWRILLTSMCVGTVAFLIIDGSRLYLARGEEKHNWPRMIVIIAVAVPLARLIGGMLSELLLGMPIKPVFAVLSDLSSGELLFVLLATGVATMMFSSRERLIQSEARAAQESARAEAIARQALQAQLQLLQAQMEPHMLFNTLANLQGLIGLDPARAQQMLDQLIVYLRATLSSSRAEVTTVAQEFALMEAYLGLMSVRMGARLAFELELPPELRGAQMPPMLLQPLVENAITHGLEPKIEGGRIVVSATARDGKLHLTVRDNGLGLGSPAAKAGTHLGLANTRSRLNAIHGDQASLSLVANAGGGARAELTLPLVLP